MLRKIYLYGPLSKLIEGPVELDVNSVPELLRGLNSANPSFMSELRKAKDFALALKESNDVMRFIGHDDLGWMFGSAPEVHLATAETGSGAEAAAAVVSYFEATGAAAKVLYAATYIATTIAISYVVGQIAMSLADQPTTNGSASDERTSFLFDQAVNLEGQGHPVPLLYGRFRAGSIVISSDVVSEKNAIAVNDGVSVPMNTSKSGNVFNNDIDGSTLTLTGFTVGGTSYAPGATCSTTGYDITLSANGDYTITAKADFVGQVDVVYRASSSTTAQTTATLTFDIYTTYAEYSPGGGDSDGGGTTSGDSPGSGDGGE